MNSLDLPRLLYASRFASTRDVAFHRHDGIELVLVVCGHCTISVAERELSATAGELFVLPRGVPHDQRGAGKHVETCYAVFQADPVHFVERPRVIDVRNHPHIPRWMGDLTSLSAGPDLPPHEAATGLLLGLLRWLALHEDSGKRDRRHAAVTRTVAVFHDDIAAPHTISDLVWAAGVSASHLTALFRQQYGCGPMQYLQRLRMARARQLLQMPYTSVKETAIACGYTDVNYFVRLFRRRHGMSPGRWRTANRSG